MLLKVMPVQNFMIFLVIVVKEPTHLDGALSDQVYMHKQFPSKHVNAVVKNIYF